MLEPILYNKSNVSRNPKPIIKENRRSLVSPFRVPMTLNSQPLKRQPEYTELMCADIDNVPIACLLLFRQLLLTYASCISSTGGREVCAKIGFELSMGLKSPAASDMSSTNTDGIVFSSGL